MAMLSPLWQNAMSSSVSTPSASVGPVQARRAASSSEGFEGRFGGSMQQWSIGDVIA
jgi:hypothetical protein